MLPCKKYRIFQESLEDLSEDICGSSTAYTLSPRDTLTSHFELDDEFKIHEDEEEDDNYFDNRAYERAEDFLDKEGLFLVSPSPVLRPVRLKSSLSTSKIKSLLFREGKNVPEQAKESKNNFAIPSFILRRNQIKRQMTI